MRVYVTQKDKVKELFLRDKRFITEECQYYENIKLVTKRYEGFYIVEVGDITTLYYIPKDSPIIPFNSHFEVTKNEKYEISNIIRGSLIKKDIIIEGSDGTGKTTLVNYLAANGILVQDRAVDDICVHMRQEVSEEIRITTIYEFLNSNVCKKVVFLYVSDEQELWNRVTSRGEVSEYDKKTLESQRIYIEVYNCLKEKCNNLFLIDTYNKKTEVIANHILNL